jgi:hypothetical protein
MFGRGVVLFVSRQRFNVHLGELSSGATSDLLSAQLAELSLELTELLLQVILALSPEGTGLDFSGRLSRPSLAPILCFQFTLKSSSTCPHGCAVLPL